MNNVTIVDMVEAGVLQPVGLTTKEKLLAIADGAKLKNVFERINCFDSRYIMPAEVKDGENIGHFIEKRSRSGILYHIPILQYSRYPTQNYEMCSHMLFLDIIRDGNRLVMPISKAIYIDKDEMEFHALAAYEATIKINLIKGDRFLVSVGGNLRKVLRRLMKQSKFQTALLQDINGPTEFSPDNI